MGGGNMNAETIAKTLGGRKAGNGWTARCPAHDDRKPSLSIRDADDSKVLVRCHAGCEQERVIAALRTRGLWAEKSPRRLSRPGRHVLSSASQISTTPGAAEAALAIWQIQNVGRGNASETYLVSRGIDLPPPTRSASMAG